MDMPAYLPMFLAETREQLQELNLAVVRVEEVPDDRETIDGIFRVAHSLKGMTAAMGFPRMAALTHHMEDVFELIRQRAKGINRDAIDVLFDCLDALSAAVEAIEADGVEVLDEEPLVQRLRKLVRPRAEPVPGAEPGLAGTAVSFAEVVAAATGRRVLHIVAHLGSTASMPSVRAYQLITAAGELGDVLRSVPALDALEGFGGPRVEIWLASDREDDVVRSAALDVAEVVAVTVAEPSAEGALAAAPGAAGTVPGAGNPSRRRPMATVRVDAERLDQLMHQMGELIASRTAVESIAAHHSSPDLQQALQVLARAAEALHHTVMQVRMMPVEAVFLRFPRLVRDLSSALGKQAELVLTGQDIELDRTVVDALGAPLVHLVRNALDHGLEPPEERLAAGKAPAGRIEISASQKGNDIVIGVQDDGRGIDPARVARKAAERGLIPARSVAGVDMSRAIGLISMAGFSTNDQASEISGRGVGLDVVSTAIRELGGEVTLTSEIGRGTAVEIRLPHALALVSALLVEAAGVSFAFSSDRVDGTIRLTDHAVRSVAGGQLLALDDGDLRLLDLAAQLGYPASPRAPHAVVVRSGDVRFALAVDCLTGRRELVTRPLPQGVDPDLALSGGALLANGEIALMVDIDALADTAGVLLDRFVA